MAHAGGFSLRMGSEGRTRLDLGLDFFDFESKRMAGLDKPSSIVILVISDAR